MSSDSHSSITSTGGEGEDAASGSDSGEATEKGTGRFTTESARAAAARSAEVRAEKRRQAVGGTATKRRPLDAIRDELEKDPDAVAGYVMKAIKEGRDVRALTAMLDRAYGTDSGHVDEPHTFDELRKLTPAARRQLWRQLQGEGRAPSPTVDELAALASG